MPPHAATAEHRHTNRLIDATSPYLLQHAHNPVDWYAWGEDAFAAAREQDKPIFLSIGYSTCYWCHVMERESFENEAIAAVMNEHFINIKVDREERPDVDAVYMVATQLLNQGQGGWPMSVWLDPQTLQPFLAGTYFPPEDRYGRPGLPSVLQQIADLWASRRADVLAQAEQVAAAIKRELSAQPVPAPLDASTVDRAVASLMSMYDSTHGGFGGAPKFPQPPFLQLLIGAAWDQPDVQRAVRHTLDRMAMGGMYDQAGGGFHRYSTDAQWLVPHFEKMLYDNGQLASVYADAFERTGDAFYDRVVRETLEYVLREMTSDRGAFFSAQDAEVNAREGGNYLWTPDEVRAALTDAGLADDIDFTLRLYGLDRGTNFQDPHHPDEPPSNVLYLVDHPDALAQQSGLSREDFEQRAGRVNAALLAVRNQREQPGTDDKTITAWNGLMIAGFADGGRVLNEARYIEAAARAAAFILEHMRTADGALQRTYRDGTAGTDGVLEDYALLAFGLLALHRATDDEQWLARAMEIMQAAHDRFRDDDGGGYFDTLAGQSDLFVRPKTASDGAVPSGNGVMLLNLLELADRTGDAQWLDRAERTLAYFSGTVRSNPVGASLSTLAVHRLAAAHPQRLPGGAAGADGGAAEVVRVEASADRVVLKPGEPATFDVTLHFAEGYHVNAHDPGDEALIGLDLHLIGGDGVHVEASFPPGEPYSAPYADAEVRIHEGTVTVPVTVTLRDATASGRPRLLVTYQVCTDRACLQPQREIVPVAIE